MNRTSGGERGALETPRCALRGVVGPAEQPEEEHGEEYPADGGSAGHFPFFLSLIDYLYLSPDDIEIFPDGG